MVDALRRATPVQRLHMAVEHTRLLRRVVWAGVAHELPDAGPDELRARFLERWLGRELAAQLLAARPPKIEGGSKALGS